MSKELKHIISEISNYKLHGIGDENWLGFQDVLKDIDILEKVLTPPTADEVCKALSEYFEEKIIYDSGSFINARRTAEVCAIGNLGLFYTVEPLPPHLVTMIGKFYEEDKRK